MSSKSSDKDNCFLCHQILPALPPIEGLGATRLTYESNRISGELEEAIELIDVLERDHKKFGKELREAEESLRMVENELAPIRAAVSSLANEQLSAIDMALGELNERQRQLGRLMAAVQTGLALGKLIQEKEREIEPLEARVNELARATDFGEAEALLGSSSLRFMSLSEKLGVM